jgi:hypothetical protein
MEEEGENKRSDEIRKVKVEGSNEQTRRFGKT